MRYSYIDDFDILNGSGIRVVLWTQGCPHRCKGCHNPLTWNEQGGQEFTEEDMNKLLGFLTQDIEKDLSILGGEPLAPFNREGVLKVCETVKEKLPNTSIWLWTGYNWEDIKDLPVIKYLDVVIDGYFNLSLKDTTLKYRGSSNQRVIDVPKSLKENDIILYTE